MHIVLHKKLLENSKGFYIKRKKCIEIIRRLYHVNGQLSVILLKEMQNLNFLELVNRRNVRLEICELDLEDTSKMYKEVGLYG